MKNLFLVVNFIVALLLTICVGRNIQDNTAASVVSLNIQDATFGQTIPSTMHGVFLETNINRGDDGGLYAELIYNRAFQEKSRSLDGWSAYGQGSIILATDEPLSIALPAHLKFSLTSSSTSISGFVNGGFYGINVQVQTYTSSFFYKPLAGASVASGKLIVGLRDLTRQTRYGSAIVDVSSAPIGNWSNFLFSIVVPNAASSTNNSFFIEFPQSSYGDFEFNLISCFPPTYKDRVNGVRKDIAQAIADLKPGFIRLPGGNDLPGPTIPERFIWNNTIGPLKNRPGRRGTWTGYNTEGFGLIELLTFAEDIDAPPILGVYAGYSLDGSSVPQDKLGPYVEQVVNETDFLLAPSTGNSMGALRVHLGRSQPFDIKYVEIGNEDMNSEAWKTYGYRWPVFYNALSQRYPNITYIATTPRFINSPPALDDHDYENPNFFIQNFRRYEKVSRSGPKVLAGEFAAWNSNDAMIANLSVSAHLEYSTVQSSVAESVYRIGFERNSDIVIGGCYAPLLQNVDNTQYRPNLILFNASSVVKSTSYLAQQMFGQHLGNLLLNSTGANSSTTHQGIKKGEEGDGKLGNLYFVATKESNSNVLIVKLANVDPNDIIVNAQIQGSSTSSNGTYYTLSAGPGVDPSTVQNTMSNPNAASITNASVSALNGTWSVTVPSWSVVVVTVLSNLTF